MDHTEELLKEITEASGVPGYEGDVRAVMRRHLDGVAQIEQDKMGSFMGRHQGSGERPRVMLAGHMDEIGFMVTLLTKEGFVKFVQLGGWWDQVLLGHRVSIKTAGGDVVGVLGAKPPHLLAAEERKKVVEKKDMYIDVGARSEEELREMGIRPGDPIIPVSEFTVMSNPRFYLSKAFDNRVGCALAVQAVRAWPPRAIPTRSMP
jgi:putative aminopeptidase FrvX